MWTKKISIVKIKTIIIAHKMGAKIIIRFSDTETEKKPDCHKHPFSNDMAINNILISN